MDTQKLTQDILVVFREIDENQDGKITFQELFKAYSKFFPFKDEDYISQEIKSILADIDSNGSGEIDYTEFLVACVNKEQLLSKKNVSVAFKQLDIDGDGFITLEEFQHVMGNTIINEEVWKAFLVDCDLDDDQKVGLSFDPDTLDFQGRVHKIRRKILQVITLKHLSLSTIFIGIE